MDANVESLMNLEKNLVDHGFDLQAIPYVLQLNKRDLPTAVTAEELYRQLNFKGEPTFEATAPTGQGVFDTLKAIAKQVLMELRKK
jgi:signal recognition particle receptor subunit beta